LATEEATRLVDFGGNHATLGVLWFIRRVYDNLLEIIAYGQRMRSTEYRSSY